ncbi:hypothetical protein [Xenorhabdus bovienii]|uniref:Uncharacterized protein n=1 Tax=Xenorhabdus bovienii str. Intermedium TaxID=1379677 RepID=A0A077QIA4_XENBV|nr:hypothetical protein [Xenorhabdus bovienii]CDH33234.1 conserved hypothetical protein [Xenorhabdus bovienii str. Intermedium]
MQRMKIKEGIKFLKEIKSDCPAFILDEEKMMGNAPLTESEQMEVVDYILKQQRTIVANSYLISCCARFDLSENGKIMFVSENCGIELSVDLIETTLIHQIEKSLLEGPLLRCNTTEKHFSLWRFYKHKDVSERESDYSWLHDFLDNVFIDGFKLLTAKPTTLTRH